MAHGYILAALNLIAITDSTGSLIKLDFPGPKRDILF